MCKLKVALYGRNGHQIGAKLTQNSCAQLHAVCFTGEEAEKTREEFPQARIYATLEAMLADEVVELVSLCSPKCNQQKDDALRCIAAGKHVYAEKPAVLSETDLDEVLAAADEAGVEFHEMADTVWHEPYWTARSLVRSGRIGQVVQVYAQKCYPSNFRTRPQDEETDGGLIRWVGVHAVRLIEHITGLKVTKVLAMETRLGNGRELGGLYTASSWMMALENGGVASICANYLQPRSFTRSGKEGVRVFGTDGIIEITDGGLRTHYYTDTEIRRAGPFPQRLPRLLRPDRAAPDQRRAAAPVPRGGAASPARRVASQGRRGNRKRRRELLK